MSRTFIVPASMTRSAAGSVPTFSVIVPVYQGARYIAGAIDSILAQTVAPQEVIVVDDGSTDDLATALAPYGNRITVLRQEHKGVAAACNLGLFHARGDFFVQCDADDAFLPELLEALGELSSAYPELDILARRSQYEVNGEIVPDSPQRRAWWNSCRKAFASDDGQRLAMLGDALLTAHSAFRRERMTRLGGFDETLNGREDYDSYVRLILEGARAGFVDECLYTYRRRPGSLSTFEVRGLTAHVAVMRKILSRSDLSMAERRQANRSLRTYRAALDRLLAKEALIDRRPNARHLSWRLVIGRGQSTKTRLKALVGLVAPAYAARWLGARRRADRDQLARW